MPFEATTFLLTLSCNHILLISLWFGSKIRFRPQFRRNHLVDMASGMVRIRLRALSSAMLTDYIAFIRLEFFCSSCFRPLSHDYCTKHEKNGSALALDWTNSLYFLRFSRSKAFFSTDDCLTCFHIHVDWKKKEVRTTYLNIKWN